MMKSIYTKWQNEEDDGKTIEEIAGEGKCSSLLMPVVNKDRATNIKNKVKAFARVQKMYRTLS